MVKEICSAFTLIQKIGEETLMKLLSSFELCGMTLKNRVVRSATMENMATSDKMPSKELLHLYEELAKGDVGLIITSGVRPDRTWNNPSHNRGMCLDRDDQIPVFAELTELVHKFGSKIVMQLGSFFVFNGDYVLPSVLPDDYASGISYRELTTSEIKKIVSAYGAAGLRASKAGFDAVQIHLAHGFPLSRFLSPFTNHRSDEYGGSIENLARIGVEIVAEIHQRVGSQFPIFIKMNVSDFCEGGMTIDDAVQLAKIFSLNGVSAIETSGGAIGREVSWLGPVDPSQWREGYFKDYAAAIKSQVDIPVILVGGLRDPEMMEEIILHNQSDLIAMSRPLIKEPCIVKRWIKGDLTSSDCTSCDSCSTTIMNEKNLQCILEE